MCIKNADDDTEYRLELVKISFCPMIFEIADFIANAVINYSLFETCSKCVFFFFNTMCSIMFLEDCFRVQAH